MIGLSEFEIIKRDPIEERLNRFSQSIFVAMR
jgi:hypothetical protein